MRNVSLTYNLLLAFVIFLGGQLLGAGQKATPKQPFSPEGPQLYLRAGAINPLSFPATQTRAGISTTDKPALYLVQFTGPIQEAWLESLRLCRLGTVGYVPDYAYLVWGTATAVDCMSQAGPLRWYGLYGSLYALHPSLVTTTENEKPEQPAMVDVIVQIYEAPETEASVQAILDFAVDIKRTPQSYLGYRVLAVRLEQKQLTQIATLPGVVNVEPEPQYTLTDEVQGQIIAGHLNGDNTRPSGPGYLVWLTGMGFSLNPEDYPIVDVTDDGIDDGSVWPVHADFYQFGDKANPDRLIYNYDWTSDPSANGINGHGNLNASIVAGYNDLSGAAYKDVLGYHYGLGINPFGRVAGSKVFSSIWGWDLPNSDFRALITNTYLNGARISTNSWGSTSSGSYTWDDQTYDALVRDAVSALPGNQEIAIIFSAGNSGPWPTTTGSPGNAKNVLAVGAAESYRPSWTDGCGIGPLGADNASDIADFSSRGPTADGRMKPDLVAPGTHIQGAASQAAGYTGEEICDSYHPSGQTLYAASSGTSHAAPAVAGAASLLYAYFQQHLNVDPPSPAMVKAFLINSARYLDGYGANDTLPSSSQGLGEVNLGRAFDGVPRILVDQQITFSESGQLYSVEAHVEDPDQPLRITLAWSDAPGAPFSAAYVNNLDLEVVIGGQTYLGNVFSGPLSTAAGVADAKNNLESVFLPAGQTGPVVVRVRATNIAGDGIPNNSDLTDQDFALVINNAVQVMGTLQGMVTDQATGTGLSGASMLASSTNWQYRTSTDGSGAYTLTLPSNIYSLSAWKYGYSQGVVNNVVITEDQTTIQDFSLPPANTVQLSGCVTDQVTGQGLAATVSVAGPFGDPITQTLTTRTNPCYNLDLYAASYLLRAESLLHFPGEVSVDLDRDRVQDFSLQATTNHGLIRGRVTDFNTAKPLSDIDLSFEPGYSADPAVFWTVTGNDGAYEILLPSDTYTVSSIAPFYTPLLVGEVAIPQSNVEERDFSMRSPHMSLTPEAPLRFDLLSGEQASAVLQLNNTGSASLEYLAYGSTGDSYSAGPDPAGYLLLDSRVSAAARYEWIDCSDGTRLTLGDDDEINIDLPFQYTYYGRTSDILRVGNNGAALFGMSDGHIHYYNQALNLAPDYLIAPYWDDLDADFGWVAYKTIGSAPNRRFVVEWFNRPHFTYDSSGITFELILYESSNNLKFQYQDVYFNNSSLDQGKSATVGIRGRGRSFLESSVNQPALVDSMALCFQAPGASPCELVDIPWLVITPEAGSLNELDGQPVTIQVNADLAGLGVHLATIRIRGNDPLVQPYIEIPIRLVVHAYELYFPFAGLPARPRPP